ncbi:hypothetical protein GCM10022403_080890 [Streptomyces coacervatus]|uniref:Transposase n=1 Tax=Streptomyces coacervatus TaxID=647381 RepID=A0ABP7J6D8_9ACTN
MWADSACAGTLAGWAKSLSGVTIKTVRRPKSVTDCVILPRRIASVTLMTRQLTSHPRPPQMQRSHGQSQHCKQG